VVVLTSKSGTDQYRGSLFEYLRNDLLDARNFFALATGLKPPYQVRHDPISI
jgi:hypothetical protein